MIQNVLEFLRGRQSIALEELCEFLRIPSVSADSAYAPQMQTCATWVRGALEAAGLESTIYPTAGHPIVYGQRLRDPGLPTVLIYGHYDVQPPDPLNLWTTPAFEPTIRDGRLYARGATDDKGQLFTHIKSLQAWMQTTGELPLNVKVLIEGEEECGGLHLEQFLQSHQELLKADVAVISDTSQYGDGIPAITCGLRGIVAAEVRLRGPRKDLHSGIYGGSIANPVNALARMCGALVGPDGRVQIPGFYDDVQDLSESERAGYAKLPFSEDQFLQEVGSIAVFGEVGWSTLERRTARPTCDINGIVGGYSGEGPKTIIPSKALAKITCRLVPAMNPTRVLDSLEAFLRSLCPPGIEFEFRRFHGCEAFVFDPTSEWLAAAKRAVETAFGQPPVLFREGGSIPVVLSFKQILGLDTLLLGWGRNSDNLHSPDEHIHLEDFHRGTLASACLWEELSRVGKS
ncbi:MAG: dipeptidase [Planctomycetaceae bacterium]